MTVSQPSALPASARAAQPARVLSEGATHRLSGSRSNRLISVLLPVKNGAREIPELLKRVLAHQCDAAVEIVAVDSGSADGTVEILRRHQARVIAVPPESFNYGRTRNLVASYARGDVFVFVTTRALPADNRWFANLIAPLDQDEEIAGVYSRVLPRPDADLLTARYYLHSDWPGRSVRAITSRDEYDSLTPAELDRFIEFSNVSAAIRPSVLSRIPFPETEFLEDRLWAKRALEAGYRIQYEPSSIVLHSHNYTYQELFFRHFDHGVAMREIVGSRLLETEIIPRIQWMFQADRSYLRQRCAADSADLEQWQIVSIMRRSLQVLGLWIGSNRDQVPVSNLAGYLELLVKSIPQLADGRTPAEIFLSARDLGMCQPAEDPADRAVKTEEAIRREWRRLARTGVSTDVPQLVGSAMGEILGSLGLWLGSSPGIGAEAVSRLSLIDSVRRGSAPERVIPEMILDRATDEPRGGTPWQSDTTAFESALEAYEAEWQASRPDLETVCETRDQTIRDLQAELYGKVEERDRMITALQGELHEKTALRDQIIGDLQAELHAKVGERDRMIADLQKRLEANTRAATPASREEPGDSALEA